ncbi:hypothetical protein MED193_17139 [Roseobacter sp. MED193]|uniref:hypothetical protein n=1 Tax=Roseobacter sp. MED193 TaxID=314262 RepID=UPI000068B8D7|nr:hypothetical protein [Roseobacter sp. MED193]EAQ46939.1 hypothetical protein MED193_17139 [Roseobacter sp. MED193]NKX37928.1 hypothetical protein [Rhodobacteraceae bacterium R_SAG4]
MVKNYLIGGLVCLVAALIIGIKPIQKGLNEAINQGTLKGAENCVAYSRSDLISPEAIKATCVSTFQKRLYGRDHAVGRAGPRGDLRSIGWGGELENKTPDYVTTWIRVVVGIVDADGNEKEFTAETQIWIDPLGKAEFHVDLPELDSDQLDDLEFCDNDDAAPHDCIRWGITDVMGLAV